MRGSTYDLTLVSCQELTWTIKWDPTLTNLIDGLQIATPFLLSKDLRDRWDLGSSDLSMSQQITLTTPPKRSKEQSVLYVPHIHADPQPPSKLSTGASKPTSCLVMFTQNPVCNKLMSRIEEKTHPS